MFQIVLYRKSEQIKQEQAELKAIQGSFQEILKDKRQESVPKNQVQEHIPRTSPLKSILKNSETVMAPGGVALHYPTGEVTDLNMTSFDDRPINPMRKTFKPEIDDSKRSSPPGRRFEEKYKYEYTLRNSPRSKSLKKQQQRDKDIAMQRREKLENARDVTHEHLKATKRHCKNASDVKFRSSSAYQHRQPHSPTRTSGLKRSVYKGALDQSRDDGYTDSIDLSRASHTDKSLNSGYFRKYYKQEELLKDADKLANGNMHNRNFTKTEIRANTGGHTRARQEIRRSDYQPRTQTIDLTHTDSVIDQHNNRLSSFGVVIDKNRVQN